MNTSEIKRRIASGAGWMVALRLSINFLGFLSTLVLARLLVPGDFGLVALGASVVAAIELLTNFRFDVSLIQNQGATRAEYDSAWTLAALLGLTLAVLLCAAAYPAAHFFNESRLAGVIFVLAGCALLDGTQNVGVVDFRKELRFQKEFIFALTRKLASVVAAVSFAWVFRSYWALVAGTVAASSATLIASYAMHPFRPRWSFGAARALVHFSKWLVLDNVVQFLRQRSSDLLIGKLVGIGPLGLFNIANELAMLAQASVVAPLNRATFPGYARLANSSDSLRDGYFSVLAMTILIALPMAIGIAVVAPLLVPLVLGDHWLESIPLINVLGLATGVGFLGSGGMVVYLATGRPRLVVAIGTWHVLCLLVGIAALLPRFGLLGAAWAVFIAAAATLPLQFFLLRRVLGSIMRGWLATVWRPVLAVSVMYFAVDAIVTNVTAMDNVMRLLDLFICVAAGVVSYVAILVALWLMAGRPQGAERAVLTYTRRFFEQFTGAATRSESG